MQGKTKLERKRAVFAYGLVISLDSISFGLIAPILAPLLANPGTFFVANHSVLYQHFVYGILMALFPLTFMFIAPLLGMLSDHIGRKRVLIYASFFISLSFAGYALAFIYKNIWMLIFARTIGGASAASQGVAQAAVVDFAKQNEKPIIISTIAIGMTMGLIVGPLVAGLWSHTTTWFPFCIVIIINFLSILFLWVYTKDDYRLPKLSQKNYLKFFFQKPKVIRLLGIFFLFEMGWSLYYQALPLWLSFRWKLQNQEVGLICSYIGTMLAFSLFLGSRVGLRFSSLSNLITFSFVFGIVGLGLLLEVVNIPLYAFFVITLPIVVAVGVIYPGLISQLSECIHPSQQGLLMGISDALLALAFTMTGMISSLLTYFSPALSFLVAATFWMVAGLLFCFTNKNIMMHESAVPNPLK